MVALALLGCDDPVDSGGGYWMVYGVQESADEVQGL
jgi:hypothetical protein